MGNGYAQRVARGASLLLALSHGSAALASAGDTDDIVETIDQSAPAEAATAPPSEVAPIVAPEAGGAGTERFELHGWARQTLELGLAKRAPDSSDTDATAVPYDQLAARSQLFIRARYSRARWFEANVSGVISYSLLETAPAHADTTFNGFNGESVRGVVEPRLYEAFIGLYGPGLDVRIGQQRLTWGNAEFLSPNDVMNARDLRDPFLSEAELRHIPTLMVRADWDLGFASL